MSGDGTSRSRRSANEIDSFVEKVIADAPNPVGAYRIVEISEGRNNAMVPTQVYRSIDRLLAARKIERIATLKAFVPGRRGERMHLLCGTCGSHSPVDISPIAAELKRLCLNNGFRPCSLHVELTGRCRRCR